MVSKLSLGILIVEIFFYSVNGQINRAVDSLGRCKQLNGYCQRHSDCCSNFCLSFGNRCIRYFDSTSLDNVSIDQRSQELSNRLGSNYALLSDISFIYAQKPLYGAQKVPDKLIGELISGYGNSNVLIIQPKCLGNGQECVDASDCCSQKCTDKHCTAASHNIVKRANNRSNCGRHGDPCVVDGDCCTLAKCHRYAHRCQGIRDEEYFQLIEEIKRKRGPYRPEK